MRQKATERKLGALDFAVAELLARLNILFALRVRGWDVASGFDYEFVGRLGADDDLDVIIRPARWPKESAIYCRFLKGRGLHGGSSAGWSPVSATVCADHLPEVPRFAFRVEPGYQFVSAEIGTAGAKFFAEVLRQ